MVGKKIKVSLKAKERDLVVEHCFPDMYLNFDLAELPSDRGIVKVEFTESELEDLIGSISAEANHASSRQLMLKLDKIADKLEKHLHPSGRVPFF
ncbi:MAG: hypothetical protein GTO45_07575 [Candidatus Aminicenantes bacterium]|nr:hypothetical protein [Candidatus Aminicenantes bacterium]NIM78695.1 hypothetical protein [Candidatus Aminicenantes bacterium]NIN17943.1 hypothetical protein [Candidatus Aminicenantes bacterium]NIN41846.1 hypothetical protein [Candidatus Aminicenantes bacterium]NIN84598.1 hypothetical protein [Candidatus Aminicenantes bacterium]